MLTRSKRLAVPLVLALSAWLTTAASVSAAPNVYDSGEFAIPNTDTFDLDKGQIVDPYTGHPEGWYEITSNSRTLAAVQVEWVKFGGTKPTYKQCKNAALAHDDIAVDQNVGKWFCALTYQQRVNRFKIVSVDSSSVHLKFTTWVRTS